MNPTDWLWIILGVLAAVMAASFAYWKLRKRRKVRRPIHSRKRSNKSWSDHFRSHEFDTHGYGPDPFAQQPFEGMHPGGRAYGAPQWQGRPSPAYPPEEIARREAARRFRPVAPVYTQHPWGYQGEMNPVELQVNAQRREQEVLTQNMQTLAAYCEADREADEKRRVDEKIQDMYFSQTGLDMVSEAVCELIDGELQHGIVAQRLRVRLYNTYLMAARKTLDTLTLTLMTNKAVREHPAYQELVLTARQMKAEPSAGYGSFEQKPYEVPFRQRPVEPGGYQQPYGSNPYAPPQMEQQKCESLREMLGLTQLLLQSDAQQILCIHEDNMEKIRRAVEKMEGGEQPAAYEIRYLELLIALRKAYCSDFVLNFDKTIDTMPHDVCAQQLKNLRDALEQIQEAYTQYPAME